MSKQVTKNGRTFQIEVLSGADLGGTVYFVDVLSGNCWDNLASFKTEQEAIDFVEGLA